jgi:hypothetical protein
VNIAAIFDVREFLQQPFEQHVMFESAALIAVFAVLVVRAATARGLLQTLSFKVDLFNALALGMALAAFLGFYFDLGASISRVTAPFLLMTLLLLVATGCRTWIVITAIAVQLLVAPSFVRATRGTWLPGYTYRGSAAVQFQREMTTLVPYAPDKGPWCNTLLTNTYPPEIAFVPAGIGLTVGYNAEDLQMPVKSKYFLLARKDAGPYGERARLRQLGTTIAGTVYLNLDSACP